jgi:glycosyltransferase involved in cell wall biosynthesis
LKVSVIIPNYNHASYLERRIDSVLNQTYNDFEVIILDDCSTDNSTAIISQYKDHPKVVKIICNETNSGSTFKQWEKGVALAKGEYVWIAESDDYADEHFLSNAMAKFEQNVGLGLYFCDYYPIDEQGGIVPSNNIYPTEFIKAFAGNKAMDGKYFCEQYLFFSSLILNASAVVFTKTLFVNADKSYMQLKVSGDWRMWVNICYNTKIFFDEKKMNFFRMHPQNVRTAKASLMGAEAVKNMVYFVKKTQDKALKQKLKDAVCKTWIYSFYLNKGLRLNAVLIKNIMLVDVLFPFRLMKRISTKYLGKKYLSPTNAIK